MSSSPWLAFRYTFLILASILFFVSMALSDEAPAPAVKVCFASSCSGGHGSGFYLYDDYFVTAGHVVANRKEVFLKNSHGRVQVAKVLWRSSQSDYALLQASAAEFLEQSKANLNCGDIAVGTRVTSVGNPADIAFVRVEGKVVAKAQKLGLWNRVVPLDIASYGGMSGGPVFDQSNRIVGAIVGSLSGSGLAVMEPISGICGVLPIPAIKL